MVGKAKKLSVAFWWHFYQPVYRISKNEDYIMPWSRLHAVKDYLSMLLLIQKTRNLRVNINISPTLLDDFINYGEKEAHDIHSRLTVKDAELLTDEEKQFILDNFFDVNSENFILPNKRYKELALKLQNGDGINDFSLQDYSDLMAIFNLVWINPMHYKKYPELKKLIAKGENYTLDDREKIIQIQREIIKSIIPEMKKLSKSGKIELTTNPYFHPVLPILLDINDAVQLKTQDLPDETGMINSAKIQITSAISKFYEVFDTVPQGLWLPELAISEKTARLLANLGIKHVVADECCLGNSAKETLTRDFDANLENPYPLLKTYSYKTPEGELRIVFRDSIFPNLISYEYPRENPEHAANDLYGRIKTIQGKILNSPDDTHLLTIALDGENCWENYKNYGNDFLEKVYKLISADNSLETVLLSDYVKKDNHVKPLTAIKSGTFAPQGFKYWIDEPYKNRAWSYLKKVCDDLVNILGTRPDDDEAVQEAMKEFFISQSSDWFWWFGEPNNSGHDNIYDFMFRQHLKNVYCAMSMTPPEIVNEPII